MKTPIVIALKYAGDAMIEQLAKEIEDYGKNQVPIQIKECYVECEKDEAEYYSTPVHDWCMPSKWFKKSKY